MLGDLITTAAARDELDQQGHDLRPMLSSLAEVLFRILETGLKATGSERRPPRCANLDGDGTGLGLLVETALNSMVRLSG